MPQLPDPRHERMAQALASGMSQVDAYETAGYQRHRGNAARLSADENVIARVAELLADSAQEVRITETSKAKAIRLGYERLAEVISAAEVVTAQDVRHLAAAVLELDKDQRVVDGGVSDRTESGSATGRLAEELAAANEWLKKVAEHSATMAGQMAQIVEEDVPPDLRAEGLDEDDGEPVTTH